MRVAWLVVVMQGCILVPPPTDPQAPPPRRVIYRHRSTPPPATESGATNDRDDDETPPPRRAHDRDADDSYDFPPAGSEDPFGIGSDWKQYTTAEIAKIPIYEAGRAYKVNAVVQEPWSTPRTYVYSCTDRTGCIEDPQRPASGWDNTGWYDVRAPRYVRRMPLPPLKPGENPFPSYGKPLTEDEMRAIPEYDRNTTYSFGAIVKEGYASVPHLMARRCKAKTCERAPDIAGGDWEWYGWWGREF